MNKTIHPAGDDHVVWYITAPTGVLVRTSLQPNPSAQTMVPPAPTATETPGRFCSSAAARTRSRARSTAAAYCGEGAASMTDGTSCGCANRGLLSSAHAAQMTTELIARAMRANALTGFV